MTTIFDVQIAITKLAIRLRNQQLGYIALSATPRKADESWELTVLSSAATKRELIRAVVDGCAGMPVDFLELPGCFSDGQYLEHDRIQVVVGENADASEVVAKLSWLLPLFHLKRCRLFIGEEDIEVTGSNLGDFRDSQELIGLIRTAQEKAQAAMTPVAREALRRELATSLRDKLQVLIDQIGETGEFPADLELAKTGAPNVTLLRGGCFLSYSRREDELAADS